MTTPQNRIEIFGPKSDGSYWLELRQSDGQSLVVSVPASEAAVLKHFQRLVPYGIVVPNDRCAKEKAPEDIRGLVAYWDIPGVRLDYSFAGENAVAQAQHFT